MASDLGERGARLSPAQLFLIFFKAGCAFGGGLGILGLLEEELVTRRRMMSRADLLALWSIGRIVPCGTMTAVTVAIGHRFGGLVGSVVALVAVILPGFCCTVAMAAAYSVLGHGPALAYIKVTLHPGGTRAHPRIGGAHWARDPVAVVRAALAVAALAGALVLHSTRPCCCSAAASSVRSSCAAGRGAAMNLASWWPSSWATTC